MPYLEYLYCEHCGQHFPLDIDPVATVEAYRADGRPSPHINAATAIWDYLVYSCWNCKKSYKYTYREVEQKVRAHFSSLAKKYEEYFDQLAQYQESEEARKEGGFFVQVDSKLRQRLDKLYKAKG